MKLKFRFLVVLVVWFGWKIGFVKLGCLGLFYLILLLKGGGKNGD